MKVLELIEQRQANWRELETLISGSPTDPAAILRAAELHRAVAADLALAESYQLPPKTVAYLNRLVARAHNFVYRTRSAQWQRWAEMLLFDAPRRIFHDRCVQFAFVLFWGVFLLSAYLTYDDRHFPEYGPAIFPTEERDGMSEMFSQPMAGRPWADNLYMAAFYIMHNTWIGLECFVYSLLIIPGLIKLVYNAAVLGAAFGYMAQPGNPASENFFEFVTAHGPFELTAIALSAGAGLRIGLSWIFTGGMSRSSSARRALSDSVPLVIAIVVLFFLAALIEGFVSPSSLPQPLTPYSALAKRIVAIGATAALLFYFVILGFGPPRDRDDAGAR